jgi:hypothetical protein
VIKQKYKYKLKYSEIKETDSATNRNILVLSTKDEVLIEFILSNSIESGNSKYQLKRAIYFLNQSINHTGEYEYVTICCSYLDVGMDDIDFIEYYFNELMDDDKLKHIRRHLIIDKALE